MGLERLTRVARAQLRRGHVERDTLLRLRRRDAKVAAAAPGRCSRCGIRLDAWGGADQCGAPDPICPTFGIAGDLWVGDEQLSRELYLARPASSDDALDWAEG